MSQHTSSLARISTPDIMARKGLEPIVMLTAYTAPMARLLDPHCDVLLVGDSLGMVVYGMDSTLGVTLDMMILHAKAVTKHSARACIIVDMPFGSYQASPEDAFRACARVMAETGCQAIKIEGGIEMTSTVQFLVERGIPVLGHVGLLPQHVHRLGGYRYQGKNAEDRARILEDALSIQAAGAFAVVLEAVEESCAQEITSALSIPTIGIGASPHCDGQVLVTEDMLGMFEKTPRFVKQYAALRTVISDAVSTYAHEVRNRKFPAAEHLVTLNGKAQKQKKTPSACE